MNADGIPAKYAALDTKTFAIGVLIITALVLFIGLLLITMQPAYGIGQTDRGGDYIMATQQLTGSQEGVVVIDVASRQMNLYALNGSNKQLQVLQSNIPLEQLPGSQSREKRQP